MIKILEVTDHWGSDAHAACAYMWWPRLRKLMIFEAVPIGTRMVIKYEDDGEHWEDHFHVYPTPHGYPQFVIGHD